MIIRMTNTKQLVISQDSKIYQRENIVDKFLILLPLTYNDLDLSKFTVSWEYVDAKNISHIEILELQEDKYKDTYYQYILPIDSEMTYFAGDIIAKISAVWVDPDTTKKYVLHTGEIKITISNLSDYYVLTDESTFERIDNVLADMNAKIGALDMIAQQISAEQVDDLDLNDEHILRVSSNGVPKGNGVEIFVNPKNPDGTDDALIDLDNTIDIEGEDTVIPIIEL